MSLWDGLQKQATKTAKQGMKQASIWIEIGKLNVTLSAANMELQQLFEQIGECIYDKQIRDLTESTEVQGLIQKVYTQKAKIKSIEKQLHLVKGKQMCENCQATIAPGTKYCPYCSHPQSREVDFQI